MHSDAGRKFEKRGTGTNDTEKTLKLPYSHIHLGADRGLLL
jgi:hypothetical protein